MPNSCAAGMHGPTLHRSSAALSARVSDPALSSVPIRCPVPPRAAFALVAHGLPRPVRCAACRVPGMTSGPVGDGGWRVITTARRQPPSSGPQARVESTGCDVTRSRRGGLEVRLREGRGLRGGTRRAMCPFSGWLRAPSAIGPLVHTVFIYSCSRTHLDRSLVRTLGGTPRLNPFLGHRPGSPPSDTTILFRFYPPFHILRSLKRSLEDTLRFLSRIEAAVLLPPHPPLRPTSPVHSPRPRPPPFTTRSLPSPWRPW